MVKILSAVMAMAVCSLFANSDAAAQVVTSYYAPAAVVQAPVVAAPVVAAPVVSSPILGTISVRRGLFGWRTENVPVLAPGTAIAPVASAPALTSAYQAARPIVTMPYQVARPAYVAAPMVTTTAAPVQTPTSTYVPNAVIQSGYRGTAPLPFVPIPTAPVQVNTFYPGAVMTMR